MLWLGVLLLVQLALGDAPVKKLEVPVGKEVVISSASYPTNSPPGTHHVWELETDSDGQILAVCEVIQINSSRKCRDGFLDVSDNAMGKLCGGLRDFELTSQGNTMTVNFKLSRVPGHFKCTAKGIKKESDEE